MGHNPLNWRPTSHPTIMNEGKKKGRLQKEKKRGLSKSKTRKKENGGISKTKDRGLIPNKNILNLLLYNYIVLYDKLKL